MLSWSEGEGSRPSPQRPPVAPPKAPPDHQIPPPKLARTTRRFNQSVYDEARACSKFGVTCSHCWLQLATPIIYILVQ
jgi:hypothetical protein